MHASQRCLPSGLFLHLRGASHLVNWLTSTNLLHLRHVHFSGLMTMHALQTLSAGLRCARFENWSSGSYPLRTADIAARLDAHTSCKPACGEFSKHNQRTHLCVLPPGPLSGRPPPHGEGIVPLWLATSASANLLTKWQPTSLTWCT